MELLELTPTVPGASFRQFSPDGRFALYTKAGVLELIRSSSEQGNAVESWVVDIASDDRWSGFLRDSAPGSIHAVWSEGARD